MPTEFIETEAQKRLLKSGARLKIEIKLHTVFDHVNLHPKIEIEANFQFIYSCLLLNFMYYLVGFGVSIEISMLTFKVFMLTSFFFSLNKFKDII